MNMYDNFHERTVEAGIVEKEDVEMQYKAGLPS
jgi:hypothetical protein